ncbi:uncharacterized protein [Callorhinus ursinus]|uniref:uncharacterized protein n=1 Tax=Callorhinus ursinus TaxID=34884 RepID=UPI003CD02DE7
MRSASGTNARRIKTRKEWKFRVRAFLRTFLEDPAPGTERRPTEGVPRGPPRSYGIGCVQAGVTASPPLPAGFRQDSKPDPGATVEAANGGSNPGLNATCDPGSAPQLTIPGPQTRKWPPITPCLPSPQPRAGWRPLGFCPRAPASPPSHLPRVPALDEKAAGTAALSAAASRRARSRGPASPGQPAWRAAPGRRLFRRSRSSAVGRVAWS